MTPRPKNKITNRQILLALGFSTTFSALSSFITIPAHAADPCVVPADCASGFCVDGFCCNTACNEPCNACSAAKKGSGIDGECGLATEGTTCKASFCNGDTFSYVGPSKCTANGNCIEPNPVNCLGNDPCFINLCSNTGCEIVEKLDGTECGAGLTCQNGVCAESMSSSSSSGGGNGGNGGAGGMNAASSSSSGNAGSGGMGGSSEMGGAGGSSSSGMTDPYPPSSGKGCTCNISENQGWSGAASGFLATLALAARFSKRRSRRKPT